MKYDHRMSFSLLFKYKVLAFEEKCDNLNAQPSTLKTVALNSLKTGVFDKNHIKFKIRYLGKRLLNKKKAYKNQTKTHRML